MCMLVKPSVCVLSKGFALRFYDTSLIDRCFFKNNFESASIIFSSLHGYSLFLSGMIAVIF